VFEVCKPEKEEIWPHTSLPFNPKLLDRLSTLKYIKEFTLPFPIIHDPFNIAEEFIHALS